jgi:hypothetical protein
MDLSQVLRFVDLELLKLTATIEIAAAATLARAPVNNAWYRSNFYAAIFRRLPLFLRPDVSALSASLTVDEFIVMTVPISCPHHTVER